MSRKLLSALASPTNRHFVLSVSGNVYSNTLPNNVFVQQLRGISTKRLTPIVSFITQDDSAKMIKNTTPQKPSISDYKSHGRPLSILLCWLMAKDNAVNKYAKFYLDNGFDVLTVRITPWQLLWPKNIDPVLDNEMLPVLLSSDHEQKVIHGFSVGGHLLAQTLIRLHGDKARFDPLTATLKGQIWDSVVDIQGTAVGVSKSVFMNNDLGQKALQKYIEFHMKVFYNVATKYYVQSHEYFFNRPLKAPGLFLASRKDVISMPDVSEALMATWATHGIQTSRKMWENTHHVGHMQKHPEEYQQVVRTFLQQLGLLRTTQRVISVEEPVYKETYGGDRGSIAQRQPMYAAGRK